MNNAPEIKDIDVNLLTGPVREALGSGAAKISRWERYPISYINTEESNLGLHRFTGTAEDQGKVRPWSIILKAVHAPINHNDPTFWNYHRREILAYQAGLLTHLPGDGLFAPHCLGVTEYADEVCWLWLEDVADSAVQTWSLQQYRLAAQHLGRFNGAYATGHPLPTQPWLSQHWLQGWLTKYESGCQETLTLIRDESLWKHPLLRSGFPHPIADDVLRLWDSHPALLATLDQLPQTFCHMDAYRPNLFIRRDVQGVDQTVAIDWAFAGTGGLGEEIANLFAASLIWHEYDATRAESLDQAVFAGYIDGLRESGWQGNHQLARLGYTVACALRWGVVGLWWLRSLNNANEQAEFEKNWKHPMPQLVSQWSKTAYYVFGLAEEAYQLRRTLL